MTARTPLRGTSRRRRRPGRGTRPGRRARTRAARAHRAAPRPREERIGQRLAEPVEGAVRCRQVGLPALRPRVIERTPVEVRREARPCGRLRVVRVTAVGEVARAEERRDRGQLARGVVGEGDGPRPPVRAPLRAAPAGMGAGLLGLDRQRRPVVLIEPARHLDRRAPVETPVALGGHLLCQCAAGEREPLQLPERPVDLHHVAAILRPVVELEQVVTEMLEHRPPGGVQAEPRPLRRRTAPRILAGQLPRERPRVVGPPAEGDGLLLDGGRLAARTQRGDRPLLLQREPPLAHLVGTRHARPGSVLRPAGLRGRGGAGSRGPRRAEEDVAQQVTVEVLDRLEHGRALAVLRDLDRDGADALSRPRRHRRPVAERVALAMRGVRAVPDVGAAVAPERVVAAARAP